MKKFIFTITTISLLLVMTLSACSSTANQGDSAAAKVADSSGEEAPVQEPDIAVTPRADQEREMPQALQLALGIFQLEETDHPVNAEQAAMLMTLWKAARSLSESETVAAEELQAVVNQIQETMTPEQLDLILSMELTSEDMNTIAEELGLEIGFGGFGNMDPEVRATMQAARESGQAPPGGFGGGSGGGGGLGNPGRGEDFGGLSPEGRQTAIAEGGGFRQAGLGIPIPMLEAVIEFLATKVQ